MNNPIIIEFVGLPGVGKSTLSHAVAAELKTRGIDVHEPIRERDTYSTPRRILSKSRFVSRSFQTIPKTAFVTTNIVLQSDQDSITDLIRVIFNIQYILGITAIFRHQTGVTLLDQGLYQACWSISLRSSQPITEVISTLNIPTRLRPNLVVFVEATDSTIASRLSTRTNGDTRFELNNSTFEGAREDY